MKKGFTLVELVIVIAIISIISALLIPIFAKVKDNSTDKIIDIANGTQQIRIIEDNNIIYEGTDFDYSNYEIISATLVNGVVEIEVKRR